MIAALLVLAVFLVFAVLMYTRTMPALLAVPSMAIVMAFVAGVPAAGVGDIIVKGASALASVYVTVILGAMLGRVTLDTGIAKSIVNFAAEFGGEQPMVLALLLCAVVAVLFVSLSGLGAIIMVGSIVLPIMMTTGVPRKIAATLFLMAFALGFIFNLVNWKFYIQLFGVSQQQMYGYALVLAAIDLVALVVYAAVSFGRTRAYATWAVRVEQTPAVRVPWFALITPVLPIALFYTLHWDPVLSFIVSAVYGAVTTRPARAIPTLIAAAIKGVEDVAPAVVLFVGIGMLFTATKEPQFVAAMHPLAASSALHDPFVFVAIFGILSPLALYRGPLNPFGVGIAIFTVLLAAHALPAVILVAAVMAVVQVQNVCDPTNTANVWVANYTGVHIEEITRRTLPYQVCGCRCRLRCRRHCIAIVFWSAAVRLAHPNRAGRGTAACRPFQPAKCRESHCGRYGRQRRCACCKLLSRGRFGCEPHSCVRASERSRRAGLLAQTICCLRGGNLDAVCAERRQRRRHRYSAVRLRRLGRRRMARSRRISATHGARRAYARERRYGATARLEREQR